MVGWHHLFDGHELEQTPRVGEGEGSLACFSPWGHKESDISERLNNKSSSMNGAVKTGLLLLLLSHFSHVRPRVTP